MSALHMVRTHIDHAALAQFAAQNGALDDDLGYALHLALRRTFGEAAPQPFRVLPRDNDAASSVRSTSLFLGYCAAPEALRQAPTLPDPDGDWSSPASIFARRFETKAMPDRWRRGSAFAFDLRLRPVRRSGPRARANRRTAAGGRAMGERDAFLAAIDGLEPGRHEHSRESVYLEWLAERLAPAAKLHFARMNAFRRTRVLRKPFAAKNLGVEGPDASIEGTLVVEDGDAFAQLLARGVGRHAAFGYGMLLLRPTPR